MAKAAKREQQRKLVEQLLAQAGPTVALPLGPGDEEPFEIELFSPENLEAEQVGYAYGLNGESFIAGPGAWQAGWLVIGRESTLSDPYFVDLDQDQLPVFTAMHGAGTWKPELVAPSLAVLLRPESANEPGAPSAKTRLSWLRRGSK